MLENKRLDLDAAKNKVKKERKEFMQPKQVKLDCYYILSDAS